MTSRATGIDARVDDRESDGRGPRSREGDVDVSKTGPMPPSDPSDGRGLPPRLVGLVLLLCAVPLLLALVGVDLGTERIFGRIEGTRQVYERVRGAFIHTILEGAAIGAAMMTGLLAIAHYRIRGGIVAPVLALALFFGGLFDVVHILLSDFILIPRVDLEDIVPLSWTLGRFFHGTILLLGIIALTAATRPERSYHPGRFIVAWGAVFGILTCLVAVGTLTTTSIPLLDVEIPALPRPWDLLPLGLYLIAAGLAIPPLSRRRRQPFVQAVWLSMAPAIAMEAYMALGSAELFDHAFHSAHALKVLVYGIPFVGLAFEYRDARHEQLEAVASRIRAQVRRSESERRLSDVTVLADELERRNDELEQFAYAVSHDLRAPLRAISNLTRWLEEDLADRLTERTSEYLSLMRNRVDRLQDMIAGLLELSRVGREALEEERVDTGTLVGEALDLLDYPERVTIRIEGELPVVRAHRARLRQVLQNLLSNATRFAASEISVGARRESGTWIFRVGDDGPGIEPRFQDRIWKIFGRLEARDDVEGTGIGLALVKRAVESWRGRAWVQSEPGEGATFFFTLPDREAGRSEPVQEGSGPRPAAEPDDAPGLPPRLELLREEGRAAVAARDPDHLRDLLDRLVGVEPSEAIARSVVAPLLREVGDGWFLEPLDEKEERLVSAAVRSAFERLMTRLSILEGAGPRLVAATPPGYRHELGLMVAAAHAATSGWRVTYLGPELEVAEIVAAVRHLEADALALGLSHPVPSAELVAELAGASEALAELPVLVGGRGAEVSRERLEELGLHVAEDLSDAEAWLDERRDRGRARSQGSSTAVQ